MPSASAAGASPLLGPPQGKTARVEEEDASMNVEGSLLGGTAGSARLPKRLIPPEPPAIPNSDGELFMKDLLMEMRKMNCTLAGKIDQIQKQPK